MNDNLKKNDANVTEETSSEMKISKESFAFANEGEKLSDVKFDTKPVSYFRDAWNRFCRNKASVVAAIIILCIVLFAAIVPIVNSVVGVRPMNATYSKKGPRLAAFANTAIFNGSIKSDMNERALSKIVGIGMAAEDVDGKGVTYEEGMKSAYQPLINRDEGKLKSGSMAYSVVRDEYLEVGFSYIDIEQSEYAKIREWERESGLTVFYPLIARNNFAYTPVGADRPDANYWYKVVTQQAQPVNTDGNGNVIKNVSFEDIASGKASLEENYMRDENGDPVYTQFVGGGTAETAQFRTRVLYYNYYQYLYGCEPNYFLGTDSQGYDLASRLAGGIALSLLVAVFVSLINFVIGAIYGSIEGYYGGVADITMERVSDILNGVPFIVVATLFQIHLATKVGAIPSLLFAFIATGWIGTASMVRTQFYRYKNQEYVMAARTLGAGDRRIIWKHIFPNALGTLITSSALVIPSVIFSESMLSYLGIVNLGGANMTSLGTLLSEASTLWIQHPHLMIVPAVIIALLMICFNLFGNGLRDAFNPNLRGSED